MAFNLFGLLTVENDYPFCTFFLLERNSTKYFSASYFSKKSVKAEMTHLKPLSESRSWRRGVVVITTAQLHSTKPELKFCAGSNPARGVPEIRDGEDLWQWSRLEIRLNALRRSTIPQRALSSSSRKSIKFF